MTDHHDVFNQSTDVANRLRCTEHGRSGRKGVIDEHNLAAFDLLACDFKLRLIERVMFNGANSLKHGPMETRQTRTSLDHGFKRISLDHGFERIPRGRRHSRDRIEGLDASHMASPKDLAESRKLVGESVADHSIPSILVAPQDMVELFAFDFKRDRHHLWHVTLEELARLIAGVAVVIVRAVDAAVAYPADSQPGRRYRHDRTK